MPPPPHGKGSLPESGRPRPLEEGYRRGSPMKFATPRLLACVATLGLSGITADAKAGLTSTCEAAGVQVSHVIGVTAVSTGTLDSIAPGQYEGRPGGVTSRRLRERCTSWPPFTCVGSPHAGTAPTTLRWDLRSVSLREEYSPRCRMGRPDIRAGFAPAEDPRLLTAHRGREAMPGSTPHQSASEPAAILRRQARPTAASDPIPPSSANEPGSGTA
jgi:hypothetical protein